MLSSKKDLTIVLVTIKSEKVIEECIESIDQQVKIIVVENTNDKNFIDKLNLKALSRYLCILFQSDSFLFDQHLSPSSGPILSLRILSWQCS